ncbi:MAG: flagellar export chaperone FliS [Phycisphaerae bacterium]
MTHQPRTEYLKTQVMTATPEMLQLMLWDGAIRFAEQGKEAILQKDIEGSYKTLLRSQKIIMELSASMRREVDPDLCGKLTALYNFIYRRLVDANLKKEPKLVDDALEIMRHQRETWVMLMDKLSQQRASEALANAQENAEAIESSTQISEATLGALPVAQTPVGAAGGPGRRNMYAGLALKPQRAAQSSLSVQG